MNFLVKTGMNEDFLLDLGFHDKHRSHYRAFFEKQLAKVSINSVRRHLDIQGAFSESCELIFFEGDLENLTNLQIRTHGGANQIDNFKLLLFSKKGRIRINVGSSNTKVFIGPNTACHVTLELFRSPTIFIGDGTTVGNARIIAGNSDVIIGSDCLLSDEIILQSTHQHPIIDLSNSCIKNADRTFIHLEDHVWVGRRALILPNVTIAKGSILGAGSVLTKDIEPFCAAAGVPAKVISRSTSWARNFGHLSGEEKILFADNNIKNMNDLFN